jgi:hypothetical protein
VLGPTPVVELNDRLESCPADYVPSGDTESQCSRGCVRSYVSRSVVVAHRRIGLYLTIPKVRLFDLDFASGSVAGFGVGRDGLP